MATAPVLPDEAAAVVEYVLRKFDGAKDVHKARCDRWAKWYRLYRSRQEFKRTYAAATSQGDVDAVLNDARSVFGADLFIPYVYSVIETTLPRMLSQNPKMNLTPAPVWPGAVPNLDLGRLEESADTLKLVYDSYQTLMRYPVTLQTIGKSGLIYGLGWGKMCWKNDVQRGAPRIERSLLPSQGNTPWVQGSYDKIRYQGPRAEALDVFEVISDSNAYDMETMGWLIDRRWRNNEYIRKMIDTGAWELPKGVDLEDVLNGGGSPEGREEGWSQRMAEIGEPDADKRRRGDQMHEIWEFHDGEDVITILDRWCPVQAGANPHWHGDMGYSMYRPTIVPHELVGIGEPEALEDLQLEMNTLRSQRRDNASLVLQRPFAYFDGLADIGDFEFGPGAMWPVDGDPKELVFPIPLQDIPGSSYQEEARLQADIERVSGINDMEAGAGSSGAGETATGAQLVHAAANVRIQNKTFLLAEECVTPQAQQMLALLQQHITDNMGFFGPPRPGEQTPWSYYELGPEVLQDDWLVQADGGSFAPENVPQERDDATRLHNMFAQDPMVNPTKLREEILRKSGVKDARTWIVPPEPQVPMGALEQVFGQMAAELQQAGVDPQAFMQHAEQLVMQAMQQQEQMAAGGGEQQQQQLPPGNAAVPA